MSDEKKPTEKDEPGGITVALNIGWELVAFTGLSFWLGYWLDGRFRSSPWGVLVLTLVGICIALYRIIRTYSGPSDGNSSRG